MSFFVQRRIQERVYPGLLSSSISTTFAKKGDIVFVAELKNGFARVEYPKPGGWVNTSKGDFSRYQTAAFFFGVCRGANGIFAPSRPDAKCRERPDVAPMNF